MASTILASIFCTEGLNLTGNALRDQILLPALTTLVSDGYMGEGGQYGDGGGGGDNNQDISLTYLSLILRRLIV